VVAKGFGLTIASAPRRWGKPGVALATTASQINLRQGAHAHSYRPGGWKSVSDRDRRGLPVRIDVADAASRAGGGV